MSLIERMLRGTDKSAIIAVLTKLCQEDKELMMMVLERLVEQHVSEPETNLTETQVDIEELTNEEALQRESKKDPKNVRKNSGQNKPS